VLRTSVPAPALEASGVSAYKDLAHLEWDSRIIKADDLDLRPIYHRFEDRSRPTCWSPYLAGIRRGLPPTLVGALANTFAVTDITTRACAKTHGDVGTPLPKDF
jgi:hypothetical protein